MHPTPIVAAVLRPGLWFLASIGFSLAGPGSLVAEGSPDIGPRKMDSARALAPFRPASVRPFTGKPLAAKGPVEKAFKTTALKRWPAGAAAGSGRGDGGGGGSPCTSCLAGSVECGSTAAGTLAAEDCVLPADDSFFDVWRLDLPGAQETTIRLTANTFDTFLFLLDAGCAVLATNDDCAGGGTDSCLTLTLAGGTYHIVANSFAAGATGDYSLEVACGRPAVCQDCLVGTAACGQTSTGSLAAEDCTTSDGQSTDVYRLEVAEPMRVLLSMSSAAIDTLLRLRSPDCVPLVENDTCGDGTTNSCLIADLEVGTYSIEALSLGAGEVGDYEINVQCWPGFDACADCRAGSIACNESLAADFPAAAAGSGCLLSGSQSLDVFTFELPTAGPVSVRLSSNAFDTLLFLYDAQCQLIAANDDCEGTNSCLEGLELAAGTYSVGVSTYVPGAAGAFTLEVSCPDVRLCRDCRAGALSCGGAVNGALEAGDCQLEGGALLDAWDLEVVEPSNVTLTASSEAFNPVLLIRNQFCEVLATNDDCGPEPATACLTLRGLAPGTYSIGVTSGASGESGAYELRAECQPFNPCQDCRTGEIACDGEVAGRLEEEDCPYGDGTQFDLYSFRIDRARRVSILLESADFDAYLILVAGDCSGIVDANDCDLSTTNACLTVDLPPGTYFLVANSIAAASGAYTLRVSCADIPYCRDCITGSMTCSGSVSGTLPTSGCTLGDGSSLDVYELRLLADSQVNIDLRSPAFNTYLAMGAEDCLPLAANDDCTSPGHSCLSLGLPAGRYFIWVNSFGAGESGPYTLDVEVADCSLCRTCRLGGVGCGETVQGTLSASGCRLPGGLPVDLWELTVDAERDLELRLESAAFDPSLSLHDASCELIVRNDDCDPNTLNACLSVHLPAGTYFLGATSLFPEDSGAYQIVVACGGSQQQGDCNQDGKLDISDGICDLGFLFQGLPAVLPCDDGASDDPANLSLLDINGSGKLDLSDGIYVFAFLFSGGPPPVLGTSCVLIPGCGDACVGAP